MQSLSSAAYLLHRSLGIRTPKTSDLPSWCNVESVTIRDLDTGNLSLRELVLLGPRFDDPMCLVGLARWSQAVIEIPLQFTPTGLRLQDPEALEDYVFGDHKDSKVARAASDIHLDFPSREDSWYKFVRFVDVEGMMWTISVIGEWDLMEAHSIESWKVQVQVVPAYARGRTRQASAQTREFVVHGECPQICYATRDGVMLLHQARLTFIRLRPWPHVPESLPAGCWQVEDDAVNGYCGLPTKHLELDILLEEWFEEDYGEINMKFSFGTNLFPKWREASDSMHAKSSVALDWDSGCAIELVLWNKERHNHVRLVKIFVDPYADGLSSADTCLLSTKTAPVQARAPNYPSETLFLGDLDESLEDRPARPSNIAVCAWDHYMRRADHTIRKTHACVEEDVCGLKLEYYGRHGVLFYDMILTPATLATIKTQLWSVAAKY
ncbi:hypothetical protein BCR37DRAFT_383844 [Protomyces lactucae-debilis]|uniref:Uncharacterized protein n=1 Tax=Protomyces lactucae-debilis TaxID=2754530 RepID=A0A1Y2EWX3_PROLT|nr:uncharacterized protein BCR37DRAFT_383844 [Protomyces lactucae-debilis]ORY75764.1 hypothetical protein BCR37DRAFT_383844 [Protomyces lactucae-debilis]